MPSHTIMLAFPSTFVGSNGLEALRFHVAEEVPSDLTWSL